MTSDITMAHFGPDAKAADDWFGSMRDVLAANVANEMFGSEVESFSIDEHGSCFAALLVWTG